MLLRDVGSYKSHTASHLTRRHSTRRLFVLNGAEIAGTARVPTAVKVQRRDLYRHGGNTKFLLKIDQFI
jgi:hypothetical protein